MDQNEWMDNEDVLIDERLPKMPVPTKTYHLVDVRSRNRWKRRAYLFLRTLREERIFSSDVSAEWEDERDRYQDMMKQLDEANRLARTYRELYHSANDEYWADRIYWQHRYKKARKQRDEAVERVLYFKGLYEQGAPMTIAGMNTRIAELEAACREALEASELCGELDEELLREVLDDG